MTSRYREDWNELARREPYYAVLTDPRFLRANLDDAARREFFATGARDVEQLFATIGRSFAPRIALDFGCGVGRLTIPLAGRVARVVGCDVSPEMLAEARVNAPANARFVTKLDEVEGEQFDLILSLIVFQHIPVREGIEILQRLMRMLAPGGVAAIHFPLRRPGGALRRLARRVRGSLPFVHSLLQRFEGDALRLPYMQMNAYDREEIVRVMGSSTRVIPRDEGLIEGALFVRV